MSINFEKIDTIKEFRSKENGCFWIHDNPITVKVIEIALLVLGVAMLTTSLLFPPILGVVITLSILGAFSIIASSTALAVLDIFIPPHHDMRTHTHQIGRLDGGELFYEGDVPILSLDADRPFEAGKAHGYLCGASISLIFKRLKFVSYFSSLTLEERSEVLKNVKTSIPEPYLQELEGIFEGYKAFAKENPWQFPDNLTFEDLLMLQILPDVHAIRPQRTNTPPLACTVIIDKKENQIARNMDWPSLGVAGSHSIVIHRKHFSLFYSSVEVAVPGMVGTITGMNSHGLSLAMNVNHFSENYCNGGLPSSMYNRQCLEECTEVESVMAKSSHGGIARAADYFLSIKDPRHPGARLLMSKNGYEEIRTFSEGSSKEIYPEGYKVTLNSRYHLGDLRSMTINAFLNKKKDQPTSDALALPEVNNLGTTHKIVMNPATLGFQVGFDDAYAGLQKLHEVPTARLFAKSGIL